MSSLTNMDGRPAAGPTNEDNEEDMQAGSKMDLPIGAAAACNVSLTKGSTENTRGRSQVLHVQWTTHSAASSQLGIIPAIHTHIPLSTHALFSKNEPFPTE